MSKDSNFIAAMPRYLRQCLVAMAAQDLRDQDNFLQWLVIREAQRRGLYPSDAAEQVAQPTPGTPEAEAAHESA